MCSTVGHSPEALGCYSRVALKSTPACSGQPEVTLYAARYNSKATRLWDEDSAAFVIQSRFHEGPRTRFGLWGALDGLKQDFTRRLATASGSGQGEGGVLARVAVSRSAWPTRLVSLAAAHESRRLFAHGQHEFRNVQWKVLSCFGEIR